MHDYIIIYETLKHGKITSTAVSQIAYTEYNKAVDFIKTRANICHFLNPYQGVWESACARYTIKELTVQ
jgi:hypothetical protein